MSDQPWTPSVRRQHASTYLLAKLESEDLDLEEEVRVGVGVRLRVMEPHACWPSWSPKTSAWRRRCAWGWQAPCVPSLPWAHTCPLRCVHRGLLHGPCLLLCAWPSWCQAVEAQMHLGAPPAGPALPQQLVSWSPAVQSTRRSLEQSHGKGKPLTPSAAAPRCWCRGAMASGRCPSTRTTIQTSKMTGVRMLGSAWVQGWGRACLGGVRWVACM